MELFDEDNGYMTDVRKLKNGESQEVKIGPIVFLKEEIAEKAYKLGFHDENRRFRFLEKKFGFSTRVEAEKKNLLTNSFRTRVAELAKKIKNKHSLEYLIEKFREMGINEENSYEYQNEMILDMISLLQAN